MARYPNFSFGKRNLQRKFLSKGNNRIVKTRNTERSSPTLMKVRSLFLGLLTLVTNVDCSGMTVTLDPFIHIEKGGG